MIKKILDFFRRKINPTKAITTPTFSDNLSKLDQNVWRVSTWTAPGSMPNHRGEFTRNNVAITNGMLRLSLIQTSTNKGIVSKGAEISTNKLFHYGSYEWEMRASSTAIAPMSAGVPVRGSVTGCFIYFDNASTEIDFEIEGNERHKFVQLTSWEGESAPNEHTKIDSSANLPHSKFHLYKFIWMPGKIEFYIDDKLVAIHDKVVPSLPARVVINHWGTNNADWGGLATSGVRRHLFVKNFTYTAL